MVQNVDRKTFLNKLYIIKVYILCAGAGDKSVQSDDSGIYHAVRFQTHQFSFLLQSIYQRITSYNCCEVKFIRNKPIYT